MKIVFVGLHNKPGLPPLCSTTKTGKIIDIICSHFNGVEFEKKNIFPVEYLPGFYEREKLIDQFEIEENTFYIGLGKITADSLDGLTSNSNSFYHPSYVLRKGNKYKKEYIWNVVNFIELLLLRNQPIIIK
jgi:hypothetical protein